MLAVMTFSLWVILSIGCGATVGFFIFGAASATTRVNEVHLQENGVSLKSYASTQLISKQSYILNNNESHCNSS